MLLLIAYFLGLESERKLQLDTVRWNKTPMLKINIKRNE